MDTVQSGEGLVGSVVPSLPEPLEKTTWHLFTGLVLGWPKAPEAGGLSRDVGTVPYAMPAFCCLARRGLRAACLLRSMIQRDLKEKGVTFFPGNQKTQRKMPLGLYSFSHRKKLCFMLLGHCLWLSKSCPEEKGQCRL